MRVLLIDDDTNLGSIIVKGLKFKGIDAHYLSSFISVIETIKEYRPNVVVIDVEIGDKDGIIESEKIIKLFSNIPIIFISSHHEVEYIERAIKYKNAYYLKKPFPIDELIAYINRDCVKSDEIIEFGEYSLNIISHELYNNRLDLNRQLSSKEFNVLLLLVNNMNETLPRSFIINKVWSDCSTSDQVLNNVIVRLRQYISDDTSIGIKTIHKLGYRLLNTAL